MRWLDAQLLDRIGGLHRDLDQFVDIRIDVDGTISHEQLLIAFDEHEAAGYDRIARCRLDQLQSRTYRICGGIGRTAQQAVRIPHLYQHRTEIVRLLQRLAAARLIRSYHGAVRSSA